MEITLKNIKHSEFASHDSNCFEATVYIDGKRAFIASDDGRGGATYFHPIGKLGSTQLELSKNKIIAADAYCHTLEYVCEWSKETRTKSLELVVGELVEEHLAAKLYKQQANRGMALMESKNSNTISRYSWPRGVTTKAQKQKLFDLWLPKLQAKNPTAWFIRLDGTLVTPLKESKVS